MLALFLLPNLIACNSCSCSNGETNLNELPVETEVEFTNSWGKWLDMTHCSTGEPVIAYYDVTQGGLGLAIGTLDGSEIKWSHQGIDGYPNEQGLDEGDRGHYASIAVDASDRIWISYYDSSLKYLRFATKAREDEEWTLGMADAGSGASGHAGLWSSITLDGEGEPIIAHYDVNAASLRVAHSNGSGGFSAEVVDEGEDYDPNAGDTGAEGGEVVPANVGEYAAITFNNGVEYIAYYDRANGNLKLAWGTAGNYSIEAVDSEGDVGQWPSIIVNDGSVHITYHDISNDQLKIASGQPGAWNIEVIDKGEAIGADSDLIATSSGLQVAYHDAYNNDIKLATQNSDGTWNTQTLAGVDGALGFHNALVEIGGSVYAASYNFGEEVVWFSAVQ